MSDFIEAISRFFSGLFGGKKIEVNPLPKVNTTNSISALPEGLKRGASGENVKVLQNKLKELGFFEGSALGNFLVKTEESLKSYQKSKGLKVTGVLDAATKASLSGVPTASPINSNPPKNEVSYPGAPAGYVEPKHMPILDSETGMGEKNPEFVKKKSKRWKPITGLSLLTIIGSFAAWCMLQAGDVYDRAGYSFVKSGLAIDADKMGQPVDILKYGIARGMGLRLNHHGDCKRGDGNHVTFATGFCAPQDIFEMVKGSDGVWKLANGVKKYKKGSTVDAKGGNQGDMVKTSTYPVYEICHVFWPKEEQLPPPVTKSVNCTSGSTGKESTR